MGGFVFACTPSNSPLQCMEAKSHGDGMPTSLFVQGGRREFFAGRRGTETRPRGKRLIGNCRWTTWRGVSTGWWTRNWISGLCSPATAAGAARLIGLLCC